MAIREPQCELPSALLALLRRSLSTVHQECKLDHENHVGVSPCDPFHVPLFCPVSLINTLIYTLIHIHVHEVNERVSLVMISPGGRNGQTDWEMAALGGQEAAPACVSVQAEMHKAKPSRSIFVVVTGKATRNEAKVRTRSQRSI